MNVTLETLKSKVASYSTSQLVLVAKQMGNDRSDRNANLVRGLVLTEVENRCGEEAVDALMDEMGL
jgi:hypothetical protein